MKKFKLVDKKWLVIALIIVVLVVFSVQIGRAHV